MLLIRSQLANVLMYLTMGVMGIGCAPLALWSRGGAYWAVKRYCEIVFWLYRVICNLRVEFRGEVPQGDVIVCSKHMSFLDVMMLAYILPRAKFIMKNELKWAPVLGFYAMRIGSAPVQRGQRSKAMNKMVAHVEDREETGQTVIYPQGTRVLPGAHREYKVGAGVLYSRMGQDCIPAATNTGVFWARRSPYRRPGVAVLEFLPMIPKGKPLRAFMQELEQVVEDNSNRLMREAGFDV